MARRFRRSVRRPKRRTGRRLRGVTAVGMRGAYPTLPAIGSRRGRRIPILGKRKASFASRGVSKRRRNVTDSGGYTQWKKYMFKKTLGRLTQKKQNFKDSANIQMMWRRCNALATNGALFMNGYKDTTLNVTGLPMYLWELNQYPGQTTVPACWIPTFTNSGLVWNTQLGKQNDGSTDVAYWQYGKADSAPGGPRFIMRYVNAKLDLWGAKAQPTIFKIKLMQFKDDDLCPFAGATTAANSEFWREFFNPLLFNPSATNPDIFNKLPFRVLWSKEVQIDPTSSTETDADPHCKSLNLWFNTNRRCNFAWKRTVGTVPTLADVGTAKWDSFVPTEINAQVDPRARLYLMVYCNKFVPESTSAAQTNSTTASINANIRVGYLGNSDL